MFLTWYCLSNHYTLFTLAKGVAERKNKTLKEMMNVMLISFGLSQNLWGEAVLSTNYILNKLPQKKTNEINLGNVVCFPRNSQNCEGI